MTNKRRRQRASASKSLLENDLFGAVDRDATLGAILLQAVDSTIRVPVVLSSVMSPEQPVVLSALLPASYRPKPLRLPLLAAAAALIAAGLTTFALVNVRNPPRQDDLLLLAASLLPADSGWVNAAIFGGSTGSAAETWADELIHSLWP
jgi:hypothetical protein